MDQNKAFDTVPCDLITSKLIMYGADDKTVELIKDYLSNRRQRVRNASNLSTGQDIEAAFRRALYSDLFYLTYHERSSLRCKAKLTVGLRKWHTNFLR